MNGVCHRLQLNLPRKGTLGYCVVVARNHMSKYTVHIYFLSLPNTHNTALLSRLCPDMWGAILGQIYISPSFLGNISPLAWVIYQELSEVDRATEFCTHPFWTFLLLNLFPVSQSRFCTSRSNEYLSQALWKLFKVIWPQTHSERRIHYGAYIWAEMCFLILVSVLDHTMVWWLPFSKNVNLD